MTGDNVVMPGAIGATQPGVTQYVLNAEEIILENTRELEGYMRVTKANGRFEYAKIKDDDHQVTYPPQVISWMQSKLRGVMNKNTYLSYIGKDTELSEIQWQIQRMFLFELFARWREFDLNEKKYLQLAEMHLNATYFATQQVLGGGVRKFLAQSTSENTSNVNQRVTEQQEKKGILGIFK